MHTIDAIVSDEGDKAYGGVDDERERESVCVCVCVMEDKKTGTWPTLTMHHKEIRLLLWWC